LASQQENIMVGKTEQSQKNLHDLLSGQEIDYITPLSQISMKISIPLAGKLYSLVYGSQ
jgi:hypothetical protein